MNSIGNITNNLSHLSSSTVAVSIVFAKNDCSYYFVAYSTCFSVVVKIYFIHSSSCQVLSSRLLVTLPFKTDKKVLYITKTEIPFLVVACCDGLFCYELTKNDILFVNKDTKFSDLPVDIISVQSLKLPLTLLLTSNGNIFIHDHNNLKSNKLSISTKNPCCMAALMDTNLENIYFAVATQSGKITICIYNVQKENFEKIQDFRPFEKKISSMKLFHDNSVVNLIACSVDKTIKYFSIQSSTSELLKTWKIPNKQSKRGRFINEAPHITIQNVYDDISKRMIILYSFDGSIYYLFWDSSGKEFNGPIEMEINESHQHTSILSLQHCFKIPTSKSIIVSFGFDNRINFYSLKALNEVYNLECLLSSRLLPHGRCSLAISPHSRSKVVEAAIGTGDGSIYVAHLPLDDESAELSSSCSCPPEEKIEDFSSQDRISIFYPNGKKSSPVVCLAWHPNSKNNSILGYATMTGIVNYISVLNEENTNKNETQLRGNGSQVYRIAWGPQWPGFLDKEIMSEEDWLNLPYSLYSVSNYKVLCQRKKNQPSNVIIDCSRGENRKQDHPFDSICDIEFKNEGTSRVMVLLCDDKGDVFICSLSMAKGLLVFCRIPTGVFHPNALTMRPDFPNDSMVLVISNNRIAMVELKLDFINQINKAYEEDFSKRTTPPITDDKENQKSKSIITYDKCLCVIQPNIVNLFGVKNKIFDLDWNIDDPSLLVCASFDQTSTVWRDHDHLNDLNNDPKDISNYRDANMKLKFSRWCSPVHIASMTESGFLHVWNYTQQEKTNSANTRKCRQAIKLSKYHNDSCPANSSPDVEPNKITSISSLDTLDKNLSASNENPNDRNKNKITNLLPMAAFNPEEPIILDPYAPINLSTNNYIIELIQLLSDDSGLYIPEDHSLYAWQSTKKGRYNFRKYVISCICSRRINCDSNMDEIHADNIEFKLSNIILLLWLGMIDLVVEMMEKHEYHSYWLILCIQLSRSISLSYIDADGMNSNFDLRTLQRVVQLKVKELQDQKTPREIDILIVATILVCAGLTEDAVKLFLSQRDHEKSLSKYPINAIILIRCRLNHESKLFEDIVKVLIKQAENSNRHVRVALLSMVINKDYDQGINMLKTITGSVEKSLAKNWSLYRLVVNDQICKNHFKEEEIASIEVTVAKLILLYNYKIHDTCEGLLDSLKKWIHALQVYSTGNRFDSDQNIKQLLINSCTLIETRIKTKYSGDPKFLKMTIEKKIQTSDTTAMDQGVISSLLILQSEDANKLSQDSLDSFFKPRRTSSRSRAGKRPSTPSVGSSQDSDLVASLDDNETPQSTVKKRIRISRLEKDDTFPTPDNVSLAGSVGSRRSNTKYNLRSRKSSCSDQNEDSLSLILSQESDTVQVPTSFSTLKVTSSKASHIASDKTLWKSSYVYLSQDADVATRIKTSSNSIITEESRFSPRGDLKTIYNRTSYKTINEPSSSKSLKCFNNSGTAFESELRPTYSQYLQNAENVIINSRESVSEHEKLINSQIPKISDSLTNSQCNSCLDSSIKRFSETSTTPSGIRHTNIHLIEDCPPGHHYQRSHRIVKSVQFYSKLILSYLYYFVMQIVKLPFRILSKTGSSAKKIVSFFFTGFCLKLFLGLLGLLLCLWLLFFLLLPTLRLFSFSSLGLGNIGYSGISSRLSQLLPTFDQQSRVIQPSSAFQPESIHHDIQVNEELTKTLHSLVERIQTLENNLNGMNAEYSTLHGSIKQEIEQSLPLKEEFFDIKKQLSQLRYDATQLNANCCNKMPEKTSIINEMPKMHGDNFNMDLQQIELMINEKLAQFDQDRIGMPDYALESGGGSIYTTRCTETYDQGSPVIDFLGFPFIRLIKSPRTILEPDIQPGNCWPIKGDKGTVVIKLKKSIRPEAITIDHTPKALTSGIVDSAPKDFTVIGLESGDSENGKILLNATYDASQRGNSWIQTFFIEPKNYPEYPVNFIEVKINNNHGNPHYTCIYRIRVHGSIFS